MRISVKIRKNKKSRNKENEKVKNRNKGLMPSSYTFRY